MRVPLALLLLGAAGFGAAVLLAGPTAAQGPVLDGSVGPGFTISLKSGTAAVTNLAPGEYTVNVNDQGTIHSFHLLGPGLDMATSIGGTGTASWPLTFAPGAYSFFCDQHASMNGSFSVGSVTTTTTTTTTSPTTSVGSTTTGTTTVATTSTTGTTTDEYGTTPAVTTSNAPPAALSALQSLRVQTVKRKGRRIVVVRIDLRRTAVVRLRLLRGGRARASLRRRVGTRPARLELIVPLAAPAGLYRLEVRVLGPGGKRVVRTLLLSR